jgi:predicted CXXCH cytochrome family protein
MNAEGDTVELPTVVTAVNTVECATCHAPHGGVAQDAQLRAPVATLCGECHTQGEEALPGNTPHHPQLEMLTGVGAVQADGSALERSHAHGTLAAGDAGRACAQCHVVRHDVEEPDEGNPNVTGHTFNPFDEDIAEHQAPEYTGCVDCHTAEEAGTLRAGLQSDIETRLAALAPFFDMTADAYLSPDELADDDERSRLANAKFNYQFVGADSSRGVHNPSNARAALDVAEQITAELSGE